LTSSEVRRKSVWVAACCR